MDNSPETSFPSNSVVNSLTVVIVALLGGAALDRCMAAVSRLGIAFLVVDRMGHCLDSSGHDLGEGCGLASVPARRRCGAETVRTPFVAFLEDTVVPCATWVAAIVPVLEQHRVVGVGGPVSISHSLPSKYRALGLCEYGRFQEHRFQRLATTARTSGGQIGVSALPGANFAFRTRELLAAMPKPDDLMVDNEIFARLEHSGFQLAFEPAMSVVYSEPHPAGAALAARYNHGRIFASRILAGGSLAHRAKVALKSLALPFVLFSRSFREAPQKLRHAPMTMFWVAAQHAFWSAGEFAGAVFGAAPDGLERWS